MLERLQVHADDLLRWFHEGKELDIDSLHLKKRDRIAVIEELVEQSLIDVDEWYGVAPESMSDSLRQAAKEAIAQHSKTAAAE